MNEAVRFRRVEEVQGEIAAEIAEALGRNAQRVRTTLAALRAYDAGVRTGRTRTQLLTEAAEACYGFVIQREMLGFGAEDAELVRREYDVPCEVWNRMGAVSPRR